MLATDAETVLMEAVDAYQAALGKRLLAAYALGSLAHGGFSPLVSDIDLGLMLQDPVDAADSQTIHAVVEREKAKSSELARRLSVFWGTPATLRGERAGGRFPPLDRLDLIENGRLLAGVDARDGCPHPTSEQLLVSGAEFALEFLAGIPASEQAAIVGLGSMRPAGEEALRELREPELLLARGPRRVTKLVLFPVRFMFTAATGRVGTNEEAVKWYRTSQTRPASELVAAALAWRDAPPTDEAAASRLLGQQLIALYLEYVDDHIARLADIGKPDLTDHFRRWRDQLATVSTSDELAETIISAFDGGRLIPLLSDSDESLDEDAAYQIALEVHVRRQRRGERPVGRKIGFTNRTIWPQYGVWAPIWGYMYDSTVSNAHDGIAEIAIGDLIQPRIEPEIQLHFARTPPVTRDEHAILECVDWIAQGFEIVQCPFPDWKFKAGDAIAAYAVHGALIVGTPVPVTDIDDCAAKLRAFTIELALDGHPVVTGGGVNVLDSPLLAFAHLTELLARQSRFPPVQAGEIITTGTLTELQPAAPGQRWSTRLTGIELPGLTLRLQ